VGTQFAGPLAFRVQQRKSFLQGRDVLRAFQRVGICDDYLRIARRRSVGCQHQIAGCLELRENTADGSQALKRPSKAGIHLKSRAEIALGVAQIALAIRRQTHRRLSSGRLRISAERFLGCFVGFVTAMIFD